MRRDALVASSSALLGGVLNAGMLTISARNGQTSEIAAYTVMTSALAWVAILVAGGTSLLYAAGDERERHAVRCQRIIVTLPVMVFSAGCVGVVYDHQGYSAVPMGMAAAVAIGNNLFELQSADLTRQLQFVALSVLTVASRAVGLLLLIIDVVPLTTALAVGMVIQLVASEVLACRGSAGRRPIWQALSVRPAFAAFGKNRQLMALTMADVFTGRAGGIALSWVAGPEVVGVYGAINGVYQALAAVLCGGLRVPMAVRIRRRQGLQADGRTGWDSEITVTAIAAVTAGCGVALAPTICVDLLRLPEAGTTWLRLFLIALPFMTISRAVILNRLGDGDYRGATRLMLLPAGLLGAALIVQLPRLSPAGTALATAVAELSAVAIISALAVIHRPRLAATVRRGARRISGRNEDLPPAGKARQPTSAGAER